MWKSTKPIGKVAGSDAAGCRHGSTRLPIPNVVGVVNVQYSSDLEQKSKVVRLLLVSRLL